MDFNLVKNRKELGTVDAQVGRFFFSFFSLCAGASNARAR